VTEQELMALIDILARAPVTPAERLFVAGVLQRERERLAAAAAELAKADAERLRANTASTDA
jgi:hypothetical protein